MAEEGAQRPAFCRAGPSGRARLTDRALTVRCAVVPPAALPLKTALLCGNSGPRPLQARPGAGVARAAGPGGGRAGINHRLAGVGARHRPSLGARAEGTRFLRRFLRRRAGGAKRWLQQGRGAASGPEGWPEGWPEGVPAGHTQARPWVSGARGDGFLTPRRQGGAGVRCAGLESDHPNLHRGAAAAVGSQSELTDGLERDPGGGRHTHPGL